MVEKIILSLYIVGSTTMILGLVSLPLLADGLDEHWISFLLMILGFAVMLGIAPIALWDLWSKPSDKNDDKRPPLTGQP